jgi:PAS domain S-box-containing protein
MQNNTKSGLLKEIKRLQLENKSLYKKLDSINSKEAKNSLTIFCEAIENAQIGVAIIDANGKYIAVNSFLSKTLGYSRKELLEMSFNDLALPLEQEQDTKLFKQIVNRKRNYYKIEKRYINKKGKLIWGKLSVASLSNKKDSKKYFLRILEDTTDQKETEQRLSLDQNFLQALMRYSPDSIYFKDVDSNFVKVNLAKAIKHGYKKEEDLIGKNDFDLYSKTHALEASNDEQEIIRTGKAVVNKEEKVSWKSGKVTWVSTTKMPLYDNKGKTIGTFGITRDISDRVKFEHGLQESEERYRTLFENSDDGIFMIKEKFKDCNRAALKLFGLKKNEILKLSPADLSPEKQPDGTNSLQTISKRISQAYTGIPQKFYWKLKKKDGNLFDSEVSFNVIALKGNEILQATVRDISDQINARKLENAVYKISEASQTSEDIDKLYKRIHEVIIELMPAKNFYISLYDEKNNILSFPYFVDEFDPPQPPKPFGKGLTEYVILKNEAMLIDAKRDLELRENGEVELVGAPQAIWLGIPLRLAGRTQGVMVVQDYENPNAYGEAEKNLLAFVSEQITQAIERKKNTEAIKEYTEELMQSNKTKDKFFSIIAHDLRNPFITILGFGDLLLTDYADLTDEERLFYVEEMKKSAEASHNLLQNLLQWSRSQTGRIEFHPTNINLKNIINSNIELSRLSAEKKQLNITTNLHEDVFVFADEDMITTVIRNLLTNAVKFTNKKGEIKLNITINDKYVETSVCDNGIGMDEETISKLFRLDVSQSSPGTEKESGTGLGLILCKEFVEKNGGSICVKSELGKGSRFSFKLPKYV